MARRFISLTAMLMLFFSSAFTREMAAFVNVSAFYLPSESQGQNYIETYVLIPGAEIRYMPLESGGFQGAVEMHILLLQEDSIIARQDYLLNSRVLEDTAKNPADLVDLNRFTLAEGSYTLSTFIRDAFDTANVFRSSSEITVKGFDSNTPSISDPTFMISMVAVDGENVFTRHGFEMIPYVLDFFPTSQQKLKFYTEIYNMDKEIEGNYLIQYGVQEKNSGKMLVSGFKKVEARQITPLSASLDLSTVPSGNYFLTIQAKDRENELIVEKRRFFFRSNDNMKENTNVDSTLITQSFAGKMPYDSLVDYALSLYPIATQTEESTIIGLVESQDSANLRRYFYLFWERKDALEPGLAWKEYKREVDRVNANYSTPVRRGYDTDRGRVWLQYGAPNDIQYGREPNAKDYEVWQYYSTEDKQNNVIFIYVNRFNVANDYELIHSTARGEIFDQRWRNEIYGTFADPNGATDIDNNNPNNTPFGTKLDPLLDDF